MQKQCKAFDVARLPSTFELRYFELNDDVNHFAPKLPRYRRSALDSASASGVSLQAPHSEAVAVGNEFDELCEQHDCSSRARLIRYASRGVPNALSECEENPAVGPGRITK